MNVIFIYFLKLNIFAFLYFVARATLDSSNDEELSIHIATQYIIFLKNDVRRNVHAAVLDFFSCYCATVLLCYCATVVTKLTKYEYNALELN